MKQTSIVIGLVMLLASTSTGCKSTPKMAWWKSKDAAEATAMAHQAPELPSDAAKKSEAKASPAQIAGGVAAPFTPGTPNVGAAAGNSNYPTTDAPAFTPSAVAQAATGAASASTGAAGPYNPAATPVSKTAPATVAAVGRDRYGYGDATAADQQAASSYSVGAPETAATAVNSVADVAGRYGMPATDSSTGVAPVTPYIYSPAPVTPASSVVSTQPYRPGGTSTYSSATTAPAVPSMASLPDATMPTAETTPTTAPAATPSSNRYW